MSAPVRSVVFVVLNRDDGDTYHVLTCGHVVRVVGITEARRRCPGCASGEPPPFVRIRRSQEVPPAARALGRHASKRRLEEIYGKERYAQMQAALVCPDQGCIQFADSSGRMPMHGTGGAPRCPGTGKRGIPQSAKDGTLGDLAFADSKVSS